MTEDEDLKSSSPDNVYVRSQTTTSDLNRRKKETYLLFGPERKVSPGSTQLILFVFSL